MRVHQRNIGKQVGRLHGRHDSSPGSPVQIGGVHQLEVLDPVGNRDGRQSFDDVQRAAHGGVPNGVDGGGNSPTCRPSQRVPRIQLRGEDHAAVTRSLVRLQEQRGLAPQGTVEKELHAARHQPLGPPTTPETEAEGGVEPVSRQVGQDAKPQRPLLLELLKGRERVAPLDVLDSRHAELVGGPLGGADGLHHPVPPHSREVPVHQPDSMLEQQAGGLPQGVADDPAALRVPRVVVNAAPGEGG